ncbi:MAG: hypothetical protein JSR85_05345 [Proteobacteria bacterium]|nr:hypothetical protein [Pseudomonadota bacterium]
MGHIQTKINRKIVLAFLSLAILFLPKEALGSTPYLCDSQYALCTSAKCSPIPGKEEISLCYCTVEAGYSFGNKPCENVRTNKDGYQLLRSRYYPSKSYRNCSNERTWADCLDKPCIVNKDNPSEAVCTCTNKRNQGDYVVQCNASCDSDIYSSALTSVVVEQSKQFQNQDKLPTAPPVFCK